LPASISFLMSSYLSSSAKRDYPRDDRRIADANQR
jgi:hypothetical protein